MSGSGTAQEPCSCSLQAAYIPLHMYVLNPILSQHMLVFVNATPAALHHGGVHLHELGMLESGTGEHVQLCYACPHESPSSHGHCHAYPEETVFDGLQASQPCCSI